MFKALFKLVLLLVIVAIFAFVVMRGLNHAFKERNDFTRFAVAGLVLQMGIQSMINIGVNLELLPAKGMTLPLISYGGSSMIAICVTAGFILALTRHRPEKRASERSLFRGGIVAYSRSVKHGLLKVPEGPVVCEAAARAMAEHTARLLDADLVVAVTGAGGPDPQDGRPSGTVCFATTGPGGTRYEERYFEGDPEKVLAKTVRHALTLLVDRASA